MKPSTTGSCLRGEGLFPPERQTRGQQTSGGRPTMHSRPNQVVAFSQAFVGLFFVLLG